MPMGNLPALGGTHRFASRNLMATHFSKLLDLLQPVTIQRCQRRTGFNFTQGHFMGKAHQSSLPANG
jgi:hypothetical protein